MQTLFRLYPGPRIVPARGGPACTRMPFMAAGFLAVFALLKPVLAGYADLLSVTADSPHEYILVTKHPSPFPQHKGQPLAFGSLRLGKAYVSFHLMPLYMCPALGGAISPALKKRMQGKTCFNFKHDPGPELIAELKRLTGAGLEQWAGKNWL
jgi:hypothetical protein